MKIDVKLTTKLAGLPDMLPILKGVMQAEAKNVEREFNITVRTFKRKIGFKAKVEADGFEVVTDDEIYGYLDSGTRPHVIQARRAPRLAFYSGGFVSKTVAGRLNPRAGRKANTGFTRPLKVNHPGTAPRNFSKIIAERSNKRVAKAFQKALKASLKSKKTWQAL